MPHMYVSVSSQDVAAEMRGDTELTAEILTEVAEHLMGRSARFVSELADNLTEYDHYGRNYAIEMMKEIVDEYYTVKTSS